MNRVKELTELHIETLRRYALGETFDSIAASMHYVGSSAILHNLMICRRMLGAQTNAHAVYIAVKRGLI